MAAPPTLHSVLEPWCCLRERGAREVQECKSWTCPARAEGARSRNPYPITILVPGCAGPALSPALLLGDGVAELQRAVSGVGETPHQVPGPRGDHRGKPYHEAPKEAGLFFFKSLAPLIGVEPADPDGVLQNRAKRQERKEQSYL